PRHGPHTPALVTPRRSRGAPRYHLNMGAPTWPPYPQRSSRPGEAAALLDMTQLRRSGRFGEWPRAQDARDLLGVQRLALEQGARERVQLLDVFLEDLPRARRASEHDAIVLAVDGEGGVLAVILRARDLATEEDVLLVLAEGERAQLLGHAPLAHHLARHLGGLLEVVAGTRRLLLQHDLLGAAATHEDDDAVDEVLARIVVLVVHRELHRETERAAARNDRHLVQRIGARQEV